MKNLFFAVALLLGVASCSTTNAVKVNPDAIAGDWNVVEVAGEGFELAEAMPYVGLNVVDGRVTGNAGCNNINGSMTFNAEKSEISFDKVAATRMFCPNMETEDKVMKALGEVRKFDVAMANEKVDSLILKDSIGNVVMKLMKRSVIDGYWNIVEVNDTVVKTTEKIPFLDFRTNSSRVFGNLGCNGYNTSIEFVCDSAKIKFGMGAMTMMMCPDIEVESQISAALSKVVAFKIEGDNVLMLQDSEGKNMLKLER